VTETTGFVLLPMDLMVREARFVSILWGPVGAGKTPLAATAPGRVAFLMFDVDGWKSIAHVRHCDVLDLSGASDDIVDKFERLSDTERLIKSVLTSEAVSTVVFDSLTSFMDKALTRGIVRAGASGRDVPTNIAPGLRGYGARSLFARHAVMNLHTLAQRYKKNLIVTAHEKTEYKSGGDRGVEVVDYITMMLSGEAAIQAPKNFSEIWRLDNSNGPTTIQVVSAGKYRPCRTRMFVSSRSSNGFIWDFDTYKWQGEGIATWMKRWEANQCSAIPLPGRE
jgi:hypothetical protein